MTNAEKHRRVRERHPLPKQPAKTIRCEICGKEFACSGRGSTQKKFCSKECVDVQKEIVQASKRKVYEALTCKCEVCGKDFITASNRSKRFCSSSCYNKKRRLAKERTCRVCGKSFSTTAQSKGLFCSRSCAGLFRENAKREKAGTKKPIKTKRAELEAERRERAEEKKRLATKQRRLDVAIRLNLFRIHKDVSTVAQIVGETPRKTRWFLRDSKAYLRYIDANNSWRSVELAYGYASNKYRLEKDFCKDLRRVIESKGYLCEREHAVHGETSRRIDLVASYVFGKYGIEAKNTNKAQKADQCLGQAMVKCSVMKFMPVCAFPSDCMPDHVFIKTARSLGVLVVNELTICKELFGHD